MLNHGRVDKYGLTCWHVVMQPSMRDKRIRSGAGLAIMALAVLSVFMVFASSHDRWSDIPLGVLYGLQALFTLGWVFILPVAGVRLGGRPSTSRG